MSKNKEKEAADRAETLPKDDNQGEAFGLPDPTLEKEVRAGIEAKRSEQRVEETEAEKNKKGHVKMHKNGEEIHVHPTTVNDHAQQGWKLVA